MSTAPTRSSTPTQFHDVLEPPSATIRHNPLTLKLLGSSDTDMAPGIGSKVSGEANGDTGLTDLEQDLENLQSKLRARVKLLKPDVTNGTSENGKAATVAALEKRIEELAAELETLKTSAAELKAKEDEKKKKEENEANDVLEIKYVDVNDQSVTSRAQLGLKSKQQRYGNPITIVRYYEKENDKSKVLVRESMVIESESIIKAMRRVVTYHTMPYNKNVLEFNAPYEGLIWYFCELKNYTETADLTKEDRQHLKLLIEYFEKEYADEIRDAQRFQDTSERFCSFQNVWHIFKPGTIVVTKADSPDHGFMRRALVVANVQRDELHPTLSIPQPTPIEEYIRNMRRSNYYYHGGQLQTFEIELWAFDSNGTNYGRRPYRMHIEEFVGEQEITTFNAYPLQFDPDRERIMEYLVNRGNSFLELQLNVYRQYDGTIFGSYEKLKGRVVIDLESYQRDPNRKEHDDNDITLGIDGYVGRCSCESCNTGDKKTNSRIYDVSDCIPLKEVDAFTDGMKALLPAHTFAYLLKERRWVKIAVANIKDIEFAEDAFDELQLDRNTKHIVEAISARHVGEELHSDIIAGKGNGVVALFHGPPGAGKTLTAESIAEYTKRPLIAVTCGDFGIEATEVEKNLTDIFNLGKAWKAVLLLDEADVFLQARDLKDLHRNSLVSVFLRHLEYFDGTLILTTNRVDTFDDAFQSRILVPVRFPNLSEDARYKLWDRFLQNIEVSGCTSNPRRFDRFLAQLSRKELNGRQIRNTVRTAWAIAQLENKKQLDESHIFDVLKLHETFRNYVDDIKQTYLETSKAGGSENGVLDEDDLDSYT